MIIKQDNKACQQRQAKKAEVNCGSIKRNVLT